MTAALVAAVLVLAVVCLRLAGALLRQGVCDEVRAQDEAFAFRLGHADARTDAAWFRFDDDELDSLYRAGRSAGWAERQAQR